jgi:cardiolipin synthase A/B
MTMHSEVNKFCYYRKNNKRYFLDKSMKNFEIFSEPRKLYKRMLGDIAAAKKSVYLETYIYDRDLVGNKFRQALIKKAEEGTRVKVLVDAWGSTVDKHYFRKLVKLGCEVRFFREVRYAVRFFTKNHERNHRKLLIIDDETAYVGSANITESCLDWNELVLRIEGDIGEAFRKSFFQSWDVVGKLTEERVNNILHKGFEIIQEIPSSKYKSTEKKYAQMIRNAKKEILIVTPYFVPSSRIRKALYAATKRGAKVRIIVPLISDVRMVDIVRTHYLGPLYRKGIEIFYYLPKTLHSKMLVVDDKFFILGSSNLDYRSFLHDFEVNLFGNNRRIIRGLREYFNETLAQCNHFDYRQWRRRSSFGKILEIFFLTIRRYL